MRHEINDPQGITDPQPRAARKWGRPSFSRRTILAAAFSALIPASVLLAIPAAASGLFSDGFEAGNLSAWSSVLTGADGSAKDQTSVVKSGSYAGRLSGSTSSGSYAYLRRTLSPTQSSLTTSIDLDVTAEGLAGSNVPILRLYTSSG